MLAFKLVLPPVLRGIGTKVGDVPKAYWLLALFSYLHTWAAVGNAATSRLPCCSLAPDLDTSHEQCTQGSCWRPWLE